ncbi:MAG: tryptophan 7-halogenase, partial [Planctomycetales bacterium]|nr:tryptophan 7-halogenase [Planctomycetales bacterium]
DQRRDTHWYRSEVDSYLFQKAVGSGVQARQSEKVTAIKLADDGRSRIQLESGAFVEAELIVDASGAAAVSAALLGTPAITSRMRTSTCAAFAHFRDVKSFSEVFNRRHNDSRADDPFDADDAAQHHLIHDGWVWMLRMNNGITSVGVTAPIGGKGRLAGTAMAQKVETEAVRVLSNRFESFPMLHQVMCDSEIVAPASGILRITRVQRFFDPLVAPNCVMLPTASVTIDPLHSTGIAHAMAGVSRIAEWILQGQSAVVLQDYRNAVLDEAMLIDRMVAMAYWSMPSFQRFCAACMVYFSAAIGCEERIAGGDVPTVFWQAGDDRFVDAVRRCDDVIRSSQDDQSVISTVREIIAPWNSVGLFESPANRYAYTATK